MSGDGTLCDMVRCVIGQRVTQDATQSSVFPSARKNTIAVARTYHHRIKKSRHFGGIFRIVEDYSDVRRFTTPLLLRKHSRISAVASSEESTRW